MNQSCALFLIPLIFSMAFGNCMILMVSIDRLLCFAKPILYKSRTKIFKPKIYVSLFVFCSLIFGLSHVIFMLAFSAPNATVLQCNPPEAYYGPSKMYFVFSNFILNLFVVGINIVTFKKARKHTNNAVVHISTTRNISTSNVDTGHTSTSNVATVTISPKQRRILTSILLVTVVYIACYVSAYLCCVRKWMR